MPALPAGLYRFRVRRADIERGVVGKWKWGELEVGYVRGDSCEFLIFFFVFFLFFSLYFIYIYTAVFRTSHNSKIQQNKTQKTKTIPML
jgi:hypothetical protein